MPTKAIAIKHSVTEHSAARALLAIETTCDETAAAVIDERLEVLGSVVWSQDALHRPYGGVVPEIASREHVARIVPVVHQALEQAGLAPGQLAAVAVAHTPGLAGSLLVGLCAAKALAVAWNVPLVALDHLQAHVFACRLAAGEDVFPCVGLVASGGHSSLFRCKSAIDFELLGGTIDDAAGEAFDKAASLLGLGYPGGPAIELAARGGDRKAFAFPRAMLNDGSLNFSFSGLKTALRYRVQPPGTDRPRTLSPEETADLCASFQEAVVDALIAKCKMALERTGYRTLCVGGGVAANGRLRERLAEVFTGDTRLHIAPPALCTDNAVMGAIAWERLAAGLVEPLELDIRPGLVRTPR